MWRTGTSDGGTLYPDAVDLVPVKILAAGLSYTLACPPPPHSLSFYHNLAWVVYSAAARTLSISTVRWTSFISIYTAPSARALLARCANNVLSSPDPYLHRAQVRVVEHKKSKQLYALKYIDKAKCIKQKAIANIIQERRLLEEVP